MVILKFKKNDERLDQAFKSLMKFGRPVVEKVDIKKKRKKDITSDIYIDLEGESQTILNNVLDSSFGIVEGFKGTGKSTIFLVALNKLEEREDTVTAYSNLQSCFENEGTSDMVDSSVFLRSIIEDIRISLIENKKVDKLKEEINDLFSNALNDSILIKDGNKTYVETQDISNIMNKDKKIGAKISSKDINISAGVSKKDQSKTSQKIEISGKGEQKSIFRVSKTMKEVQILLKKEKIESLYLFLDDFSELSEEFQKIALNNFIGPIVKSYNEFRLI